MDNIDDFIKNLKKYKEYNEFIQKYGYISQNGVEIYGIKDGLDHTKIPSVIGATQLYKDNGVKDDEIVISFDDYENSVVVLNPENKVFLVSSKDDRKLFFNSFNEWFEFIKDEYELEL